MNKSETNQYFERYLSLRAEVDSLCKDLTEAHSDHLSCKKGCSSCCMDFSVFPLEFFAINHFLNRKTPDIARPESEEACPFLVKDACTIYDHRPIICRTQGLPLLFTGDEGWELSACELNFTNFDFSEFDTENTFPQDKFNSKLYLINKEYIESLPGKPYGALELLELRTLLP